MAPRRAHGCSWCSPLIFSGHLVQSTGTWAAHKMRASVASVVSSLSVLSPHPSLLPSPQPRNDSHFVHAFFLIIHTKQRGKSSRFPNSERPCRSVCCIRMTGKDALCARHFYPPTGSQTLCQFSNGLPLLLPLATRRTRQRQRDRRHQRLGWIVLVVSLTPTRNAKTVGIMHSAKVGGVDGRAIAALHCNAGTGDGVQLSVHRTNLLCNALCEECAPLVGGAGCTFARYLATGTRGRFAFAELSRTSIVDPNLGKTSSCCSNSC